jgi:flavin reductase (DIM6/NTAB) family NADH-FMN oxidoreductase RutF
VSDTEASKATLAALGRVPSGVFILTARNGPAETGMLASWVQQCAFQPPLLTVAVRQGREVLDWLGVGQSFILNVLDESQTDMVSHFGRGFKIGEPAFSGLEVQRTDGSAPILSEALAWLRCRVTARHPAGDHELLLAEAIAGAVLSEGRPMVHVRKTAAHY